MKNAQKISYEKPQLIEYASVSVVGNSGDGPGEAVGTGCNISGLDED